MLRNVVFFFSFLLFFMFLAWPGSVHFDGNIDCVWPVIGTLVLALAAFVRSALKSRALTMNQRFSEFAESYGGRLIEAKGWSDYPAVVFEYRGMPVKLEIFMSATNPPEPFTCFRFETGSVLRGTPPRLEVTPFSLEEFRKTRFRGLDVLPPVPGEGRLGNFTVQSDDIAAAAAMLKEGLGERIRALGIAAGPAPAHLSVNRERAVINKMCFLYDARLLRDYTRAVFAVIDFFVEKYGLGSEDDGIVIIEGSVEAVEAAHPLCEICGTTIHGMAAVCTRCETPHHIDCWNFNGACSTFACGSTTFTRRDYGDD